MWLSLMLALSIEARPLDLRPVPLIPAGASQAKIREVTEQTRKIRERNQAEIARLSGHR